MELTPISASLGAMGSLPRKLHELLATGHWALRGLVMDEIGQLTADVHILLNLLLNLSNAQEPPVAAGYWMKEVRELSYDMVDFADQFIRADARAKIPRATRPKTISRLKINRLPERRKWLPWITNKVLEFRTRAQEATQRYWSYKFDDCASNPGYFRAPRVAYPEPGDHVGMEGPTNEIDRWLTNGQEELKVVAIVGVAGVGKTTLALKLWGKLQGHFECHAFVRTAQKPNMRGIISSILSQVRPHQLPDLGDMHYLIRNLREHLQDKMYFIIIDDLWATSVWDVLSRAFPEGSCCSRIIITTEIMEVARACCGYCPDHIFQMEFLSEDDSQKLLLQRILSGNQSPQHFDHVLPHILRKCSGLPLAIIMVASLLAGRPEEQDRLGFAQNSSGSNLPLQAHSSMEGFMGQLLNIVFDSLPHYLKTCLLYLSTFTEGYIFLKDDLVKLWIAEDFICAQLGEDMEELARSYFDELVSMCLIQVMDINYNCELLSYSVHHMVLDLITYKSIEENFVTVVDYSHTAILIPEKVRRLALHFGSATYATAPANTRVSQVRSLFFFGLFNCMPSFVAFKLLRVLDLHLWGDLGNTSFDLTRICQLVLLRYLQVTCNVTVKLPDQIEAMKHLETLEINSRVCAIPPDIVHLQSLLHLCLRGVKDLPDGIGCIRSLRTLKYFDLGDNSEDNLWGLGKLINLRDLHFTYSTLPSSEHLKRNLIALASSLGKLCDLKSVALTPGTAGMVVLFDGLSGMSSVPVSLERLELLPPICIFSRLPKWIGQLRKICIMKVAVKELLANDIDILTGLPSLTGFSLCVHTAPEGRVIFSQGAFPVLKYFEFRCGVLCMAFMAGAMTNLRRLKLAFNTHISDKYSNMLAGIEHLLNLEDITGRIGAATKSDRRAAELAFREAISKHPMCPRSSVQWVDPIEKEYFPSKKQNVRQEEGSSGEKRGALEKAEDTIKHAKSGKTSFAGLDQCRTIKDYRNSCSSGFFLQKRIRTRFFCIRRTATKIGQSYTTTKGGADKSEKKKERKNQQTRLNYLQRKNQQQSSSSSASVGNETDSRFKLAGQGMETGSNIIWNQDLPAKVKEREEEIAHLRRHLADYSVKETQILNDKLVLEKQIAHMRMEFDRQQQVLAGAASKALSHRQNNIDENIRLAYTLQAAHQETSTFVSSLLPLLSEHNLQPSVPDAQSIVSNLKVLFGHLQEKLIIAEEKRKESQYQISGWGAESINNASAPTQSASHPPGDVVVASSQPSIDIVTQQVYSDVKFPMSCHVQARQHWDFPRAVRLNLEFKDQNRSLKDHVRRDGSEKLEGAETQISQVPPGEWGSEDPPNMVSFIDASIERKELQIYKPEARPKQLPLKTRPLPMSILASDLDRKLLQPYLRTVRDEPNSFSEEDDPMPAIDELRITGEAFPGRELQASGYSINGTTRCNFEWVRHLEDGSVNCIEGARQPTYLVTADDVDSLLAIEVQPLDDRKRKGKIVKVYANGQRKITCNPEMKELIKKILSIGHVSYKVLLAVKFTDMWKPAVLAVTREGYSIKCNQKHGVVIREKFQQATVISIPYARPTEFSIQSADGAEYNLKPAGNSPSRDSIVLILRLFIMMAVEKSKGRKRGIFFK
ncbi:hypothetical protein ACQ4PT_036523 [Festuca glaucescens]